MQAKSNIDAMKFLLMKYQNERDHAQGMVNSYLNSISIFEIDDWMERIDKKIEEVMTLENKIVLLTHFLSQVVEQSRPSSENAESAK